MTLFSGHEETLVNWVWNSMELQDSATKPHHPSPLGKLTGWCVVTRTNLRNCSSMSHEIDTHPLCKVHLVATDVRSFGYLVLLVSPRTPRNGAEKEEE